MDGQVTWQREDRHGSPSSTHISRPGVILVILPNCLPYSRTALTRISTAHLPQLYSEFDSAGDQPVLLRSTLEAVAGILASTWPVLFYILASHPMQVSNELGLAGDLAVLIRRHFQVMTKI